MIGGPNGSGKTTLIKQLLQRGAEFGLHFNADEIAREMDVDHTGDPVEVGKAAQAEVRRRRDIALYAGLDYSWETVMSHPSHIEHLAEAREKGYQVRLIYVAISKPSGNIERVKERVDAGGHSVPMQSIYKRYFNSLANLSAAIVVSHRARIFDNSYAFEPFRLVATYEGGILTDHMNPTPDWFLPTWEDLRRDGR